MQTTFKALLIAIYAAAIVSLFGVLPSDLGHLLQRLSLILLVIHAVELALMFKAVRRYPGPLATSILLTLLFGLLHWKPLADAARRGDGR
ncbi:MAG: DUF1145 domain-containing protein [Rhodoferax sp.]|nr:DUF1145 domain-containing protein [Rhodoferax sp.]